jgi:hypothetical protein
MIDEADSYVDPALWSVINKAQYEIRQSSSQRIAAVAVCEAIPNQNNVWHLIFNEHKRRYEAREAYWLNESRKAFNASQNLTRNVMAAHR